jgi:hypothetical protein
LLLHILHHPCQLFHGLHRCSSPSFLLT